MDVIREIISFVVLPGVGEKKPVSRERPLKFCCSKWIVLLTFKSVKYFFNKQAEYERPFAFLPSYFETPDLHTSQKNEKCEKLKSGLCYGGLFFVCTKVVITVMCLCFVLVLKCSFLDSRWTIVKGNKRLVRVVPN